MATACVVTASSLNVRSGPSRDSPVVRSLPRGARVDVIDSQGAWRKLHGGGWAHGDFLRPASEQSAENGKVWPYRLTGEPIQVGLYDFDVNGHALKVLHMEWLAAHIVPVLRGMGSMAVLGQASRTGDEHSNLVLSGRRIDSVVAYLRNMVGAPINLRRMETVGEMAAAAAGHADAQESEFYRSVIVSAWYRPTPPPDPPPPPPRPFRLPCGYYDFWIRFTRPRGDG
jgi:hypothetical protein